MLALALLALVPLHAGPAVATSEDPLPEARVLLEGLAERQRSYEQELNDYTYDVEIVDEQLDGSGAVKSTKSRRYETFYVKKRRVQRLVAEDGVQLSSEKQAKVDKDVKKLVDEAIADKPRHEPTLRLSEIVERYDFRSLRREDVAGRPAIVLDFVPRPGKSKLELDNVLRQLAGQVWIDEAERVAVRSTLRNTGGIKFALGIGASLTELEVITDFVKVDDRIWLPRRVESRVIGRILLFKGLRERTTASFSGYRRFETTSEEAPKRE